MSSDQRVIIEAELAPDELEPSETFARLVKRVGDRATLGALGLDAMEQAVRKRASGGDVPIPVPVLHASLGGPPEK
jgi:hypothetical protein